MRWLSQLTRRNALTSFAAVAVTVFAAAYLGIVLTRETGWIASIWLANGVVVLALLKTSPGKWPGWILSGLLGNLAANLAYGDVNWLATTLSLVNSIEVLVVGGCFRLLVPGVRTDLARARHLLVFIGVGGVAGPAVAAFLAASFLHWRLELPLWTVFRTWFSADSLGLLMLVPLFAGADWEEFKGLFRSRLALEGLAILLLVPFASGWILQGHAAWLFLLSPLFVWASLRFGFAGVACAILLTAASGVATLLVRFHAGHLADLHGEIAFLQVFLFTMVLIFLPMASLLKALRKSEALFRLLFDKAPIGMAILDSSSGRFLSANPRLGEILGYAPEVLLKHDFMYFTHPDDLQPDLASVRQLRSGELDGVTKEKRYLHRSGRTVRARLRMVRLPTAPDSPERHLTLVEDITSAALAQEEKLQALDRLQKITERVPGAVYQYRLAPDGQTSIPYASEAMVGICGIRPEDLRADPARLTALHHPEDRERIAASIQASARDLSPWKLDYRLKFPDGSIRHLLGDAVPEREEDGAVLWTGFLADVTERRQMEDRLIHSQKMESLGVLAGGVAHDMNNVLGAILALASAHLTLHDEGSPAYKAFDTIYQAASRGGSLVKGLLNFARQSPAERQILDLNAVLLQEAHLLEHSTLAKVRLEQDLAPDLKCILGDGSALHHTIMNLCVNAVDAMPDHGTLTLRTRNAEPGRVEVEVEDTGTGMPPEVLAKAMDPFFTTKGVGKGTGLGLSIVYATVTAHQGEIELWSEPGKGTRVRLSFPALAALDEAPRAGGGIARVPPAKALRVLLVDDNDLILDSTQVLLEVLGHTVTPAMSGEAALALLDQGLDPEVVILDMNMPGLGGKGTLPRLRRLHPDLPVILATGRADQEALDLILANPGSTLMPKPFSLKELEDCLARSPSR